jgi:hypothetical protein
MGMIEFPIKKYLIAVIALANWIPTPTEGFLCTPTPRNSAIKTRNLVFGDTPPMVVEERRRSQA